MDISVAEAQSNLTQLLDLVERGERVTIYRHGQPVVDLVPTRANQRRKRTFGAQHAVIVDPDWAKPQNNVEDWLQGDV